MGEVYCRRVVADVRGETSDLDLFTLFSPSDGDMESGGLQVEATNVQDYWRTPATLHADDLSQTLAVDKMHTALEALTTKFKSSRVFEYTLDEDNILHIRFTIGKVRNRLRVTLQPAPAPAQAIVAAMGALGANLRRQRAAIRTLSEKKSTLHYFADWSKEKSGVADVQGEEEAEGDAALLTEKMKELRLTAGMPEEPEAEMDALVARLAALEVEAEDEENLVPKTAAAVEERRAESPDRGSETAGKEYNSQETLAELLAKNKTAQDPELQRWYQANKTAGPDSRYFVYVLELGHGKYYVGATDNPYQRFRQHFAMKNAELWVREWGPPQSVVALYKDCGREDEHNMFLEYCSRYGWENVRGGECCSVEPNDPERLQLELDTFSRKPKRILFEAPREEIERYVEYARAELPPIDEP